jgi:heme-degrading monooxygenase HmoA
VTRNKRDDWQILVMWEFVVRPGKEAEFEKIYGPEGDWAQCFSKAGGYCGTELCRDLSEPGRFVTSDFWMSQEAYETFKAQHAAEYRALDQKCESLTEDEREIGKFKRVVTGNREP